MYQVLIKEVNGAGVWAIDIENVKNNVIRNIQMTRTQIEVALIFLANKEDKFLNLLKRVLQESNQNNFFIEINDLRPLNNLPKIFKDISVVPKAGEALVIIDFEGTIFSPVIYDANDQSWNYKDSEIRQMIIKQWAYQSDLYPTLNLPATSEQEKRSIRHELEQQIKQEKDKKRHSERKLMEDLKQSLSKAFPDATIEINEIKMN
ncbi:hypothetical protein [Acinetobacter ursingii]|uniref:hypothetical protein n=1 Tax=Acinetobacter ursingii TaxID=108980 RepID=UPI003AF8C4FE